MLDASRCLNRTWTWARARPVVVLALLFVPLVAWAWHNRFLQDDGYIYLRYARNLAEGNGLVYNIGERVEGYTSTIWVLLLSTPFTLGWPPERFVFLVGITVFAASLVLVYALGRSFLPHRWQAYLLVALTGSNFTFAAFATGGLETPLHGLVVLALFFCWIRLFRQQALSAGNALLFSLIACIALLVRMDTILFILPLAVSILYITIRKRTVSFRAAALLVLPAVMLLAGWTLWRLGYYGDALPNTFANKVLSASPLHNGFLYVVRFLLVSWIGIALGILLTLRALRRMFTNVRMRRSWMTTMLWLVVGIWTAYLIGIGGDFMEFRMFAPVIPILYLLLLLTCSALTRKASLTLGVGAFLLAGSLQQAAWFSYAPGPIGAVQGLRDLAAREGWHEIGTTLRQLFPDAEAQIATTAAGVVPFVSRLPTVDMHGLTDRWIAQHGIPVRDFRPGHQLLPQLSYLRHRQVSLLLGHPRAFSASEPTTATTFQKVAPLLVAYLRYHRTQLPPNIPVLTFPLPNGRKFFAIYLEPAPPIEALIREQKIELSPLALEDILR